MEHREADHELTELPDGSWWGTIKCSCGWARGVADHPNEGAADLALHAAWVVHTGKA